MLLPLPFILLKLDENIFVGLFFFFKVGGMQRKIGRHGKKMDDALTWRQKTDDADWALDLALRVQKFHIGIKIGSHKGFKQ